MFPKLKRNKRIFGSAYTKLREIEEKFVHLVNNQLRLEFYEIFRFDEKVSMENECLIILADFLGKLIILCISEK